MLFTDMGYFSRHSDIIDFSAVSDISESGLRECQMGAFWAVNSHFSSDPESPALVSLPTGAGKTALMMLLSFGFEADRVLVVTASEVLRTQTKEKFDELDGLTDAGVVPNGIQTPTVEKITTRMTDDEQWEEIDSDVVVSLPHNISKVYDSESREESIVHPPEDKFDLVLFDEAHHVRAPSWMELLETFGAANRVLLTATPFRRDRETLPGNLVYHYSLDRAIERGLYHPIELRPVQATECADPNQELAVEAKQVLEDIREEYQDGKLLIRCGSISAVDELIREYSGIGLDVESVHSKRTSKQNQETLESLKEDELDGVIAVGMLGEGVDNPDLKAAVLHEPPKSFPFTLQLIGRVTRPINTENTPAAIIADPDELRREGIGETVKRLYHEDRGWGELIPDLVSEYVDTLVPGGQQGSDGQFRGVNESDLEPYLSTRIYEISRANIDFATQIDIGSEVTVHRLPSSQAGDFLGLITRRRQKPAWGTRTPLSSVEYDLHLYYYEGDSQTLFESSTSDRLAKEIRSEITQDNPDIRGGESLVRVLQSDGPVEYQVAGLANALGPSKSLPSYKMLLGERVEGAIKPSDPKAFTQGHAVAEVDGETIGMSEGQGTVWSTGREKLDEFKAWCDTIASKLTQYQQATAAPSLGLGEIQRITEFPQEPFFGILNPATHRFEVHVRNGRQLEVSNASFGEFSLRDDNLSVVDFEFLPRNDGSPIEGTYNVASNSWNGDIGNCTFIVDDGDEFAEIPAEQFFERYPPYFYTGDGELIYSGRSHAVNDGLGELPESSFVEESRIDWSNCATWIEYDIEETDDDDATRLIDIHQWTEEFIMTNGEDGQIIFYDHGSGEIADYVQIEADSKTISYYHCKKAKKDRASGARLSSIRDVVEQVLRSVSWIADSRLPSEMVRRASETENSHFVVNEEPFQQVKSGFTPMKWEFRVVIVHPGINHTDARESENINTVLLTCLEWLESAGATLQIIGDPDDQVVSN